MVTQHNCWLRILGTSTILSTVFTCVISAHAEENRSRGIVRGKILGGEFAPSAAGGKVAYIDAHDFQCSGVLVGEREVLTAAHCIIDGPGATTDVYVGGAWRRVESAWYQTRFDMSKPISRVARFDLGMLILAEPVVGTAPIPVMRSRRLSRGATVLIAGYGTHERSHIPHRTFLDDFKLGAFRLLRAAQGMLHGDHRAYRSSVCAGDSGGPATVVRGRTSLVVVGIASAGANTVVGNRCRLRRNGEFMYVDLQSASSRNFLSYFPGVRYSTR